MVLHVKSLYHVDFLVGKVWNVKPEACSAVG